MRSLVFKKKTVILRNKQCCERRNFQKIAISIINLTMKKLPKLDEFNILG